MTFRPSRTSSYVELLDLGDLEGLANVFARATVRVDGSPDEIRGADAFREFIEKGVQMYDGIPSTKHLVTNLMVEIDDGGSAATARSYYVAFQARPERALQPILAGRFHDRLERDREGWHIVERVIYSDLVGNVRFHIAGLQPS